MSTSKVVLVLGATGSQGGGVVKALSALNSKLSPSSPDANKILAVTRSASSAKARALLPLRGIVLLEGNVNEPDKLFHDAIQLGYGPVYGVFSVQQSMTNPDGGVEGEERQGKAVADAAAKNGVQHFVYSSVDMGRLEKTDVTHFESKRRVEAYIKSTHPDLSLTILRPTYFMDNIGVERFGTPAWAGTASMLVHNFSDASKTIQTVACSDIGRVAALAFENPNEYVGKTISLAGDESTIPQIQVAFKHVFGYDMPVADKSVGNAIKAQIEDLGTMFKFFEDHGYKADMASLRQHFPSLKTWEDFFKDEVKPFVSASRQDAPVHPAAEFAL